MSDKILPEFSTFPTPSVTRRAFLKSWGAAAGVLATSPLAVAADSQTTATAAASNPSRGRTFHVMPHSHIDVEWYWTFATAREWTKDILDKAMALLRRDPQFRFTQDQVVLLKSYWEGLGPEDRAFFKQMAAEGRLALVGGMYVQPEVAEPGGESLVRQILVGQQWLMATLGVRARCGWFIDTFGQIPQLPQILRLAGYDSYVFLRDIPPTFPIDTMPADFLCESPDGSRILTHWMAGGYSTSDAQVREKLAHSHGSAVLLPFGSDVSRPTQDSSAMREEMAERLVKLGVQEPQLKISTAPDYLEKLRGAAGELPVLKQDFNPPLRVEDLRGTYSNRIELKKSNRTAEAALYNAECLAAIASLGGLSYPHAAFAQLWERLLFTHFHDTMGGSHSDPVYRAAMERLASVQKEAEQMALNSLRHQLPKAEGGAWLVVYNTLSYARTEPCQLRIPIEQFPSRSALRLENAAGQPVPFREVASDEDLASAPERVIEFVAEEIPATGYRAYRLATESRQRVKPQRRINSPSLENDRFRLEWNPQSGDLTRLYDKRRECEVLAGPSNVLIAAKEQQPELEGDLHLTGEVERSSDSTALLITPTADDLGVRLRTVNRFADALLERETVLFDGLDRIHFRTILHNFSGGDVLIKASFAPLLDWSRAQPVYETPFASTQRPAGHFAAQTWVDCSDGKQGVALLNRGTPGYWIGDRKLELVLLRSFANYTGYQQRGRRRNLPGYDKSTQTELAREHGTHEFDYALLPHAGTWRTAQLPQSGRSYNTPLLSLPGLGQTLRGAAGRSFLACSPDFVLTALKQAEDGGGLILRGYETKGEAHPVILRLPRTVKQVRRASLLEEPAEELPVSRGQVKFACRPHEIVTLRLRC